MTAADFRPERLSLAGFPMTIEAVVFDLDGTVLNTLGDIASAANRALVGSGFPPHPDE
jgi:phosphoglycolate phosphatase-like HAD superfamily hydrolase